MADLVLEVHPTASFADKDQRQRFISFVVAMLAAGGSFGRPFEAYKMNGSTSDLEWVVDAGNDWFLFFDPENPLRVRIRDRYDVPQLKVLGEWIAYRWRAKVVMPDGTPA
jgi:hypothetical protein